MFLRIGIGTQTMVTIVIMEIIEIKEEKAILAVIDFHTEDTVMSMTEGIIIIN